MFPELTALLLIRCSIEINLESKSQIKYIDTKNQLADLFTKGHFTRDEWNHLLSVFNIIHLVLQLALLQWLKEFNNQKNESQRNQGL